MASLKRCPCCGDLEDKRYFEYSLEWQENICVYCAEDERDKQKEKVSDAA
jgi:hypothetical protein